MNILTPFWPSEGGAKGEWQYTEQHVRVLESQIPGIRCLPLHTPAQRGWWVKMDAFHPKNRWLRPFILIDLDTFVLGDFQPLLELDPSQLWLVRDWVYKNLATTSLMVVPDAPIADKIWKDYQNTPAEELPARDDLFVREYPHKLIQDEVSGIVSYKMDCKRNVYPENARIVCFHGNPKPPYTGEGYWAREWWDKHAGQV